MTRIGRRLIEDFLLPALNDERYGDLLKWIDREKRYFSIRWSHKNAAKWTLADTAVFQDWDRLKGHFRPEAKGYYMQAKQRFRAALYKLSTVRKVQCDDKHVKKYQLILDPDKKNHEIMSRKSHQRMHKVENQKSIPTPVICRNTSFIAKAETHFDGSNSLPSSPDSIKSEGCDRIEDEMEMEMCVEEYQRALRIQRKQSTSHYPSKTIKTEVTDCPAAVLRESPEVNIRKAPHVPIQPVPVYNKCGFRLALESFQKHIPVEISGAENCQKNQGPDSAHKRVESPRMLLVPTYIDLAYVNSLERNAISVLSNGIRNNRKRNLALNDSAVDTTTVGNDAAASVNEDSSSTPDALNLSVKSDNNVTECR